MQTLSDRRTHEISVSLRQMIAFLFVFKKNFYTNMQFLFFIVYL